MVHTLITLIFVALFYSASAHADDFQPSIMKLPQVAHAGDSAYDQLARSVKNLYRSVTDVKIIDIETDGTIWALRGQTKWTDDAQIRCGLSLNAAF